MQAWADEDHPLAKVTIRIARSIQLSRLRLPGYKLLTAAESHNPVLAGKISFINN